MKRLRFASGETNGQCTIPPGQILAIGMVPGVNGTWFQINESKPIFCPPTAIVDIKAQELAAYIEEKGKCDLYPGDAQITLTFGQNVSFTDTPDDIADAPQSWCVIYNGG